MLQTQKIPKCQQIKESMSLDRVEAKYLGGSLFGYRLEDLRTPSFPRPPIFLNDPKR